ncbi:MAG: hypothetical protein ACYCPN_01220 [Thermoplasmata archaeon]
MSAAKRPQRKLRFLMWAVPTVVIVVSLVGTAVASGFVPISVSQLASWYQVSTKNPSDWPNAPTVQLATNNITASGSTACTTFYGPFSGGSFYWVFNATQTTSSTGTTGTNCYPGDFAEEFTIVSNSTLPVAHTVTITILDAYAPGASPTTYISGSTVFSFGTTTNAATITLHIYIDFGTQSASPPLNGIATLSVLLDEQ